jgi:hypothetical protein
LQVSDTLEKSMNIARLVIVPEFSVSAAVANVGKGGKGMTRNVKR